MSFTDAIPGLPSLEERQYTHAEIKAFKAHRGDMFHCQRCKKEKLKSRFSVQGYTSHEEVICIECYHYYASSLKTPACKSEFPNNLNPNFPPYRRRAFLEGEYRAAFNIASHFTCEVCEKRRNYPALDVRAYTRNKLICCLTCSSGKSRQDLMGMCSRFDKKVKTHEERREPAVTKLANDYLPPWNQRKSGYGKLTDFIMRNDLADSDMRCECCEEVMSITECSLLAYASDAILICQDCFDNDYHEDSLERLRAEDKPDERPCFNRLLPPMMERKNFEQEWEKAYFQAKADRSNNCQCEICDNTVGIDKECHEPFYRYHGILCCIHCYINNKEITKKQEILEQRENHNKTKPKQECATSELLNTHLPENERRKHYQDELADAIGKVHKDSNGSYKFCCEACNNVSPSHTLMTQLYPVYGVVVCSSCYTRDKEKPLIAQGARLRREYEEQHSSEPLDPMQKLHTQVSCLERYLRADLTWTKNDLRRLRQDHADKTFQCPICDQHKKVSWINFDRYEDNHVIVCNICNKHEEQLVLNYINRYGLKDGSANQDVSSETQENQNPQPKEETKMFNANKLFGGAIGPVTGNQFKLSFMGLAVRGNDGAYYIYNGNEMVDVADMVMDGMDNGIFQLPVTTVEVGDLILHQTKPYFVREVFDDNSIEALNPLENKVEVLMPAGNLFGFKFFTKVTSLFQGMLGNIGANAEEGANPLAAIQPMIMMQMFAGKDGGLFGGGKDGDNGFLQMMLMSQLFGGGQGSNPFEQMFAGFAPKQTDKAKSKTSRQKKAPVTEAATTPAPTTEA